MAGRDLIEINGSVGIPATELVYRASRASGPGGQHVNTSATRIELTWNIAASPSIDEDQRSRLLEKLRNRIDSEGVLRLTAAGSRSQARNKQEVTERFRSLVRDALRVPKPRRRTRPRRAAKEARLLAKRRRSEIKRGRGRVTEDE